MSWRAGHFGERCGKVACCGIEGAACQRASCAQHYGDDGRVEGDLLQQAHRSRGDKGACVGGGACKVPTALPYGVEPLRLSAYEPSQVESKKGCIAPDIP